MTQALPTGVITVDMTVISAIINRARNEQARNEQIVVKLLFNFVKIFATDPTNIIALKIKYAVGKHKRLQIEHVYKIKNFKDYKFQRLQISKTTNFKD